MEPTEFSLNVDVFKPETFPMERLAAYMREFAKLLGSTDSVHFKELRSGSTTVVAYPDASAVPKVERRMLALRNNSGPQDLRASGRNIDDMLAEDNGTGKVFHNNAVVIEFPGRNRPKPEQLRAVKQREFLDGELVQIGGRDETVPVHLYDPRRDCVFKCNTSKERAKELAHYLFAGPVRVLGEAEWDRDETGKWVFRKMWITEFFPLERSATQTIAELRAIPGNEWHLVEDPLAELLKIRYGSEVGT